MSLCSIYGLYLIIYLIICLASGHTVAENCHSSTSPTSAPTPLGDASINGLTSTKTCAANSVIWAMSPKCAFSLRSRCEPSRTTWASHEEMLGKEMRFIRCRNAVLVADFFATTAYAVCYGLTRTDSDFPLRQKSTD